VCASSRWATVWTQTIFPGLDVTGQFAAQVRVANQRIPNQEPSIWLGARVHKAPLLSLTVYLVLVLIVYVLSYESIASAPWVQPRVSNLVGHNVFSNLARLLFKGFV
jgi:hypothetical protein